VALKATTLGLLQANPNGTRPLYCPIWQRLDSTGDWQGLREIEN
jgi:hypothetical protein